MEQKFTFENAFAMQLEHIEKWAKILTTDAYLELLKEVIRRNNEGYNSPYGVCRGSELSNIVENIKNNQ